MKSPSLLLASIVVAGLSVPARAATIVDGQVPYEFTVGLAKLPAGHYQIQHSTSPGEDVLLVRNVDTGKTTAAEYLTRIAPRGDGKSLFVFDVVGGQHILSEIQLASSDGYLLPGAAKKPHTHEQVKAN